ncbi:Dehydrogenase E1 component [Penicillium cosmopolitanum]|uniref:2-oxoglutarate dehydrogenase, mitochondrial n=1 Tax=Penicillium cosmopolitanum TaxID=1131564 RepID=A0A9X0B2Y4_9EURO|nr:Dehydrogenase E1 component [Penicillium cosmopolitanum]KAJ5386209.1 Dehydrogenase E1 component [Penicillium cosmopolitanum]
MRGLQPQRQYYSAASMASSSDYLDHIYTAWRQDPASVHSSWREYFNAVENGLPTSEPTFEPLEKSQLFLNTNNKGVGKEFPASSTTLDHYSKTVRLVRAYQDFGHKKAKTNPLNLPEKRFVYPEELKLEFYGFTESDMDHEVVLGPEVLPYFVSAGTRTMTLREIIKTCESLYCGSIGAECSHVETIEERQWIRERLEVPEPYRFTPEEKKRILDRLVWTTNFEKFMSAKFPNAKRFSIEGVETQIPALKAIIDASAENGVKNIIFPCCHRGKLNVLSNVGRKPNELIFSEFSSDSESRQNISGDVKYHLGISHDRKTPSGKDVNVLILPNPSHLEAQNTLGQGMARAVQHQNHGDRASTMVLNSHTDASFSGQGVIYETLGLSGLKFYETGGTVHLIINNQIGFTTDADSSRTSPYASDIAKSIAAPIFHVNADDAEAVVFVCKMAADYRARFGKDCWVDMICYRKHGHNEMDQPFFTQPMMYEQIEKKTPHLESYTKKLAQEGVVTVDEVKQMEVRVWEEMARSLENSTSPEALEREYLTAPWRDMKTPEEVTRESFAAKATSIDHDMVGTIASKLGVPAEPFQLHKSLRRILQKRQQSLADGRDIDWATAEALAMGSLCLEGHHVRVSGQDVERGTFSQRHAVLHDQKDGGAYLPLNNLSPGQGEFTIGNSSLSEYGVMGFDYGYSCMYPNSLVMWEAQFGDFANNAQCIIDQFISSAENKWLLRSGLVLSLPHGFDGQGPEHSSARMERFLQLCSEDGRFFPTEKQIERQHQDANMQVVQMTTPANIFHVLRRQLHRDFRKPLILFFSKSLLRHPSAKSHIEEFTGDSQFQPLIADPAHGTAIAIPSEIKRVIYCSGQVYFALASYRDAHGITDTAITRIEQLHPFPWEQARDNLIQYSNASDIVWCQEESLNDGPWSFAKTRLETIFDTTGQHKGRRLRFAGRGATPSVATGFGKEHRAQEAALLEEAFQRSG